jgi:hypothetical protein
MLLGHCRIHREHVRAVGHLQSSVQVLGQALNDLELARHFLYHAELIGSIARVDQALFQRVL